MRTCMNMTFHHGDSHVNHMDIAGHHADSFENLYEYNSSW